MPLKKPLTLITIAVWLPRVWQAPPGRSSSKN